MTSDNLSQDTAESLGICISSSSPHAWLSVSTIHSGQIVLKLGLLLELQQLSELWDSMVCIRPKSVTP